MVTKRLAQPNDSAPVGEQLGRVCSRYSGRGCGLPCVHHLSAIAAWTTWTRSRRRSRATCSPPATGYTARLDGVAYLEKPPLIYWMIAVTYKVFGVHDWAARIPIALSAIALCWLTAAFGIWAFGKRAGFYAGLCMATCVGLFLFTRVLIPDVMLTFTIALAMWALLRVLDEDEPHPRAWALHSGRQPGHRPAAEEPDRGCLPRGAALIYLVLTQQLFLARTWKRLRPFQRTADHPADRRSLARAGHAAQSAVFSTSPCTAGRANTTASSGSSSSTSSCCAS